MELRSSTLLITTYLRTFGFTWSLTEGLDLFLISLESLFQKIYLLVNVAITNFEGGTLINIQR
uniref:Uncharacterized protein n=1 Tax=Lepeophtheirus salmonis TaxID=72036 RepID=A0A0K2TKQ7_LEPSM